MKSPNFLDELKRRNVLRVAGLYLVGAWLITQVASTVLPMFGAPDWLPRSIVILLAIGFVPALIFSWVFELTPEGLRRDEEVKREKSIAPQTARRMDRMIIVVLLLALGYFAFDKFVLSARKITSQAPVTVGTNEPAATAKNKSIAVLPFANLSEEKANAYFADGIQDEILTRLSKIADLKVISRTSTQQYQSKPGNLSEIAKQLGVAHILEGSVQRAGEAVRINVQLIKAEDDSHLWADTYDRKLTDIFAVETEVAERIATSLAAQLTGNERQQLAAVPTKSPKAYDAYLRGLELMKRQRDEDTKRGRDFFKQAVEIDPNYAQAWAQLAIANAELYYGADHTPACQERARNAAETAVRLQPSLGEAHAALGVFYYLCQQDYDRALLELQEARKESPNDASNLFFTGLVKRRQGKLAESIEFMRKATISDPRNQDIWGNLGRTYRGQRNFADAREMFDRALAVSPDEKQFVGDKAEAYAAEGDLTSAEMLVGSNVQTDDGTLSEYVNFLSYRGRLDEAIKVVAQATNEGKVQADDKVWLGSLHLLAGHEIEAKKFLEEARKELSSSQETGDKSLRLADSLLFATAALGDGADTERQSQALLARTKNDLWRAQESEEVIAAAYAVLGDADRAVPLLQRCLTGSYRRSVTVALLRLDPIWGPIRNDPRFQELMRAKP